MTRYSKLSLSLSFPHPNPVCHKLPQTQVNKTESQNYGSKIYVLIMRRYNFELKYCIEGEVERENN